MHLISGDLARDLLTDLGQADRVALVTAGAPARARDGPTTRAHAETESERETAMEVERALSHV